MAATASALVLVVAVGLFLLFRATDQRHAAEVVVGGPFTLFDSQNRIVTDRDFRGRFMLVYFGYTSCPDVCPTTLVAVTQALARLGERGDSIQPVFITIDPKRDTVAVMGRYVAAFSPRLIGLTGSPAQLQKVEAEYHVVVRPGSDPDAIDHSAVLYLMGSDGRFLAPLPTDATPAVLAADFARFINPS
jgi:cytochrome oxidase Cu insertion factor (SCO1/SenC/PrrC family)